MSVIVLVILYHGQEVPGRERLLEECVGTSCKKIPFLILSAYADYESIGASDAQPSRSFYSVDPLHAVIGNDDIKAFPRWEIQGR